MPKPPSLTARANRSLSVSFGGGMPVRFGIRWYCRMLSSFSRYWPMHGVVRDHLLDIPWVIRSVVVCQ